MMQMSNVNREIEKMLKSAVLMLSSKYNFDVDEAVRMICECEGLTKSRSSKKVSTKEKMVKSLFPLPYNGELKGECCFGIRQNSGLYTQCPSARPEDAAYCGSCNKQATKNEHGLPDYGSIQTRLSKYTKDEEFVDPSGKKPVAYTKVMKKLKLTEEQVREEAAKHNMVLDPRHFVEAEKKSGRPAKEPKEAKELKAKGRPKKSKKVLELAGEEEDLFASLVMSSNKIQLLEKVDQNEDIIAEGTNEEETVTSESEGDDNSSLGDVDIVVEAKPSKASSKASPEEKEALANLKKEALAFKKAELAEQKKLEALAQQEKKKIEALAQQEKKVLAKQEAEQKKLEALAQQEKKVLAKQEAEQKKLALAEQKKLEKPATEKKKAPLKKKDVVAPTEEKVADEEADVVKKIMFEGKKYLKSKNTGIIYNMEQDVIGKWNEEKNRIDFNVADEESEDEYDEDM